ncbi:nodulin MtN21 /EamA-like transporter family protein [Zostera marina]|uniref:WAT1-related protein n=1 Tax=Zostera marina TaxID=29655 RepID=A0A0K9PUP7_ZOSMR|nr:nodulin MtN21 /EamA-like transporter family protein [Zostera marina]
MEVRRSSMMGVKLVGAMVIVQMLNAGTNIFYKLVLNDGMSVQVLVTYRFLFSTVCLSPIAFFMERKKRPSLTWTVLLLTFFSGLFGGALVQNIYIQELRNTSATFATAIINLIPATTFVLCVCFGFESFSVTTTTGIAKITGTLLGLGGAMVLTFYRGPDLNLWSSSFELFQNHSKKPNHQAQMIKIYPFPYSSASLMCINGTIQSMAYAFCVERNNWDAWALGFDIRLLSIIYIGIVANPVSLAVMSWCVEKKGPLFTSIFNPLVLLFVAIFSSVLLNEKLHLGILIGGGLIVMSLYCLLWGKAKEYSQAKASSDTSLQT